MKVTLGLTVYSYIQPETLQSLIYLVIQTIKQGPTIEIVFEYEGRMPVIKAFKSLLKKAQQNGSDFLFLLQDDIVYPEDALIKLLMHNKAFSVGWFYSSAPLFIPYILKGSMIFNTVKKCSIAEIDDLQETNCAGLVSFLIKMEVANKINWNEMERQAITTNDAVISEFIEKQGHSIYIDKSVECGHVLTQNFILNSKTVDLLRSAYGYLPDISTKKPPIIKEILFKNEVI